MDYPLNLSTHINFWETLELQTRGSFLPIISILYTSMNG